MQDYLTLDKSIRVIMAEMGVKLSQRSEMLLDIEPTRTLKDVFPDAVDEWSSSFGYPVDELRIGELRSTCLVRNAKAAGYIHASVVESLYQGTLADYSRRYGSENLVVVSGRNVSGLEKDQYSLPNKEEMVYIFARQQPTPVRVETGHRSIPQLTAKTEK